MLLSLGAALAIGLPLAALSSRAEDWQPVSLVLALGALLLLAEVATIGARNVRVSSGLTVQVTIMALLGPAPAVAFAIVALALDAAINRVGPQAALANAAIFTWVGLVGGVLFELLGDALGLDRGDTAYAALVLPVYCAVAALDIVLLAATSPTLTRSERLHLFRDSALPTIPWELVSCVIAAAAVLVWAHAGLAAAAVLLGLLLVTTPLMHALESAIKNGDDRARLLAEVLNAEERERARLAESLHEGPMQRLLAMRQDVREGMPVAVAGLDATIAETRAIVSALHPSSVRALGFEGSLRAAIAPFVACRPIELAVDSELDDDPLVGTLLLPIARELVVNAVKHGQPALVDVSVRSAQGAIVLEVADDGDGFDALQRGRAAQAGHLGLAVVRRRVEDAGGRFEISSAPGGGTRSRVMLGRVSG